MNNPGAVNRRKACGLVVAEHQTLQFVEIEIGSPVALIEERLGHDPNRLEPGELAGDVLATDAPAV